MPSPESTAPAWSLVDRIATAAAGGRLDLDAPARGIVLPAGDALLGIDLRTPCRAGDHWLRGDDLIAIYGHFGGRWRGCILWALNRETDNDRFLVDGICVARNQRGKGIGSLLLSRLCDEAARRGYRSIRLDVIDANWRARALYERQGFTAISTESLGALRHVFGFASATTMVRPICAQKKG